MQRRPKIIVSIVTFCIVGILVLVFCPIIVLGRNNLISIRAVELQHGEPTIVRVSGACGHLFSIKRVKAQRSGSSISILVYASLVSPVNLPWEHDSGIFEYDLSVPKSVSEIRFGKKGVLIWKRAPDEYSELHGYPTLGSIAIVGEVGDPLVLGPTPTQWCAKSNHTAISQITNVASQM